MTRKGRPSREVDPREKIVGIRPLQIKKIMDWNRKLENMYTILTAVDGGSKLILLKNISAWFA